MGSTESEKEFKYWTRKASRTSGRDGSAGEGTCHQAWQPEFTPLTHMVGAEKWLLLLVWWLTSSFLQQHTPQHTQCKHKYMYQKYLSTHTLQTPVMGKFILNFIFSSGAFDNSMTLSHSLQNSYEVGLIATSITSMMVITTSGAGLLSGGLGPMSAVFSSSFPSIWN